MSGLAMAKEDGLSTLRACAAIETAGRMGRLPASGEVPDLFVDIETLGLTPGCVILQVALLRVWPGLGWRDESPFVVTFDAELMQKAGFSVDGETLEWWLRQPDAVIEAVCGGDTAPPEGAARIFNWFKMQGEFRAIWSRGHFDLPILGDFLGRYFATKCWEYWQVRDFRTLQMELDPEKALRPALPPGAGEHVAAVDVARVAEWLCRIMERRLAR